MTGFVNPSESEIRALLERIETIAVVGLSPNRERPSHRVAAAMKGFGYRIVPVRPGTESVLGERAYADLRQVPHPIDLVDVFRAPEQVEPIVDATIERRIKAIWFQEGVVNERAAQRARSAGLFVVMDRCVYREYVSLFGERPRDRAGRPSG